MGQASPLLLKDHYCHLQMSSLRPCGQEAVAPGPTARRPHCRNATRLGLAASLAEDGPTGTGLGNPRAQGHQVPLLSTWLVLLLSTERRE